VTDLTHLYSGKVRDIYDVGDGTLLFVASDRMSAFDVVMAEPVPDKGRLLTAMTVFWAEELRDVAPTHLVSADPADLPGNDLTDVAGRSMVVRKAEMLSIECIVRGYLTGSAWSEYKKTGTVHGQSLPSGMQESEAFPEPIFTPSTKAEQGEHDVNISYEDAVDLVGKEAAEEARRISMEMFGRGRDLAAERGIIIADTKFELGWIDGRLAVCDEILTPDSSRFWAAEAWAPGTTPPSFDKQPLRDWLEATGWDKTPPPPTLPSDVVEATRQRYVEAYERITGRRFADWHGVGR
jgi:phosphoribosylaminoimidazole-succinocarboxamide synthase